MALFPCSSFAMMVIVCFLSFVGFFLKDSDTLESSLILSTKDSGLTSSFISALYALSFKSGAFVSFTDTLHVFL